MSSNNPFQYEAANNLSDEMIAEFYVEDFNFSRVIQSKRNILLVGERGSGKTMALLYNSLRVQLAKHATEGTTHPLEYIGVYIPCNTPLIHRKEYQLLADVQASVVSEHFLVLAVIYGIAQTLMQISYTLEMADEKTLRADLDYVLGMKLREGATFYEGLRDWAQKEIISTQKRINNPLSDSFYEDSLSFASGVMPLLGCIRQIPALRNSHLMLMVDDAHDLNEHQSRSLNSWIAYRDHSAFSLKVATAKVGQPDFKTATGGSILEGHDFTTIDMEQPFQNALSDFGHMAAMVIDKRLKRSGIDRAPKEFFPVSPQFEEGMRKSQEAVKEQVNDEHPDWRPAQVQDYVYKFARAHYYRERSRKANRPAYSGFDALVFLSTGVIRNLLEPCYLMYDAVQSQHSEGESGVAKVTEIPPDEQTNIIMRQSEALWSRLKEGLDRSIDGCASKQAKQIANLFEKLAAYFRHRLLHHKSEPQANSFSITGMSSTLEEELGPLLIIARKAQLLYVRLGSAKAGGLRETYYVPNRILWPSIGLDLHGQHARASLKAKDLLAAADGRDFPVNERGAQEDDGGGLFDE